MNLSEKIKKARLKSNLTQNQLAEKMNISRKTLSGWENDRGKPDLDNINRLSKILNEDSLYFITDDFNLIKTKKYFNYLNISLLVINSILLFVPFHIPGISLFELIISLITLNINNKLLISKNIKWKSATIILLFSIFMIISVNHSATILGVISTGGIIGSLLKSSVLTLSSYLTIIFLKNNNKA